MVGKRGFEDRVHMAITCFEGFTRHLHGTICEMEDMTPIYSTQPCFTYCLHTFYTQFFFISWNNSLKYWLIPWR